MILVIRSVSWCQQTKARHHRFRPNTPHMRACAVCWAKIVPLLDNHGVTDIVRVYDKGMCSYVVSVA
jgi:hypothetical protein